MRITQGTFSFLEDLTDEEIEAQISYALSNDWAIMVEYTDDPHPRNSFWEMWKQPEFDLEPHEADVAMRDVVACREAYPNHYVKVVCYDSSLGRQTSALSFIVNRPAEEPGFRLERQDKADRQMRYTLQPYALKDAAGRRYGNKGDLATTRDPAAVQDATPGRDSPLAARDGSAAASSMDPSPDGGVGDS
ncbi:MAG: ribulose bisphosphate carboxylase small subunit [Actinobacteria bacterium]|nr:ribulose bisphosphate carboxylase small subunit [Actinomycetota bacterium]